VSQTSRSTLFLPDAPDNLISSGIATLLRLIPLCGTQPRSIVVFQPAASAARDSSYIYVVGRSQTYPDVGKPRVTFQCW
jgi:hypothetical protein